MMASGEQGPSLGSITAIQVLASYAPAELVLRHAADLLPAPPSAPEREDFEGAVGFVDVSGFTALSERLQKDFGNKGSEKLNQYINSYLTRLIDGPLAPLRHSRLAASARAGLCALGAKAAAVRALRAVSACRLLPGLHRSRCAPPPPHSRGRRLAPRRRCDQVCRRRAAGP